MFKQIGAPEIILILVVLLLLFGAKRLPDLSRSIGRSMRIFKSEVKEMRTDEDRTVPGSTTPTEPEQPRALEGTPPAADESARTRVPDADGRER
ncbi:MAG: sec-independent protein translocase protein TatA [Actinomycetota bacterium]|jgi:sec-independent protein translocase protein TatA|nr:sec-independent protein translocase protein TatA [Actinomycetota bacterium]